MADMNRFFLHDEVPNHVRGVFSKWYSRTGAERANQPIRQGEFQDYAEWWNDWFSLDEEEEEGEEER